MLVQESDKLATSRTRGNRGYGIKKYALLRTCPSNMVGPRKGRGRARAQRIIDSLFWGEKELKRKKEEMGEEFLMERMGPELAKRMAELGEGREWGDEECTIEGRMEKVRCKILFFSFFQLESDKFRTLLRIYRCLDVSNYLIYWEYRSMQ